jgi:hypothetical protein
MSEVLTQYKRPDIEGGVLTDAQEIAYYRHIQSSDVRNNLLLGDFNQNGHYIVKKEIVSELIELTKVMQHSYGKTLFCTSLKEIGEHGTLEFAVKIERLEGKKAVASLELLEGINKIGGYYQNINTVLLATYTDSYDLNFLSKVYKAFHVISKEDDYKGRKKLETEQMKEIIARKDYLLSLQKISQLSLSDTEKQFYEERIAALSKSGEYGKSILLRLQLQANKISKLFLNPNDPNYYQKMNQLLDKVLEEKEVVNKTVLEQLNKAKQTYIQAQQAILLKVKQDLLNANKKTLLDSVLKAQLNDQEKAQNSIKQPNYATYSASNMPKPTKDPVVKVQPEEVEQVNKKQTKPQQPIVEEEENLLKGLVSSDKVVADDKNAVLFESEEKNQENSESVIKRKQDTKQEVKNEKIINDDNIFSAFEDKII